MKFPAPYHRGGALLGPKMGREIDPSQVRAVRAKMKQLANQKTFEQRKGTEVFNRMLKSMGPDGYCREMKRRDDEREATRKRDTSNHLEALAREAIWEAEAGNRFSLHGIGEGTFEPRVAKKTKIIFHADGTTTTQERIY